MKQVVIIKRQGICQRSLTWQLFTTKGFFSINMGRAVDVSKVIDALSCNFLQARQGFEQPGLMKGVPCPWQGGWNKMSFQPKPSCDSSGLPGWAVGQVISWLRLCSEVPIDGFYSSLLVWEALLNAMTVGKVVSYPVPIFSITCFSEMLALP